MSDSKKETERDIYDIAVDNKDGKYGFVVKELPNTFAVVTSESGLKLRKSPSVDSDIFRLLPYGAKVEITESLEGWSKVMAKNGDAGYCMSDFLEVL